MNIGRLLLFLLDFIRLLDYEAFGNTKCWSCQNG